MTESQLKFEKDYHYKIVKPLGKHYIHTKIKEYIVTSAFLNWEDDGNTTVFAIKALDYSLENKDWITFKIGKDEFDVCMGDFEIIRDGYEDFVRPKIIDEILLTWGAEKGEYITCQSSIYTKDKGFPMFEDKLLKSTIKKEIFTGLNEYVFIFKSIYDLDKPSCFIIRIPDLQYRDKILEWVKPFRQKVLDNKIVYGNDISGLQESHKCICNKDKE